MPRVGHTGATGTANMMMMDPAGGVGARAVNGFPDSGVQGKYRTVVSVSGDHSHEGFASRSQPQPFPKGQGHMQGQHYLHHHVQAPAQGHHPRSSPQQGYPLYGPQGYPGGSSHGAAQGYPGSNGHSNPQGYSSGHGNSHGYPENGSYHNYSSQGSRTTERLNTSSVQQSYNYNGNGHHNHPTHGLQGHSGNGYGQEYSAKVPQGYQGYDQVSASPGYQQDNGSLHYIEQHSRSSSASSGSSHQGYAGNGHAGYQNVGNMQQYQQSHGQHPQSPAVYNGYPEIYATSPRSPEYAPYEYQYDSYSRTGNPNEYMYSQTQPVHGAGHLSHNIGDPGGAGYNNAQVIGKPQAGYYPKHEEANGHPVNPGSNGDYYGSPSPGSYVTAQVKDSNGYGKQNGHVMNGNGHATANGSNGYGMDARLNGLKLNTDSPDIAVKSASHGQNGLNGSTTQRASGYQDNPTKQVTAVKTEPPQPPPPPSVQQMPKQTVKSVHEMEENSENIASISKEKPQNTTPLKESQNNHPPVAMKLSNGNKNPPSETNNSSTSPDPSVKQRSSSSSSSEHGKSPVKQHPPSPISRQMKELGKDIETYYKEHFYMSEHSDQKEKEKAGEVKSGPHDEDHPFFVVGRDIRKPDTLREHKIISSKGTVRGFKNRVRAGIATFLDQDKSKLEDIVEKYGTTQNFMNYREREKGKIVVYTTSMRIVRDTYEMCVKVKNILHNHMVKYEEKDIFMSRENQRELLERLGDDTIEVPQVFADGVHLGGAEQMEIFNESGELRRIFKHFKHVTNLTSCTKCGGYQYIPCMTCHGSKKSLHRNHFTEEFCALRCITCDENGLVRCDRCKDEGE